MHGLLADGRIGGQYSSAMHGAGGMHVASTGTVAWLLVHASFQSMHAAQRGGDE